MKHNLYLFLIAVILLVAEEENEPCDVEVTCERLIEVFHE